MVTDVATINPAGRALAILDGIPTLFGRLVYLAALWDQSAGSYRSDPRVRIAGPEEVDAAMGRFCG